jgi:signal transduction histidine kinase
MNHFIETFLPQSNPREIGVILRSRLYILITAFFVLLGYLSILRLINKPDLPFEYYHDEHGCIVTDETSFTGNQCILSVNGFRIVSTFQLEFILDSKKIGESVDVVFLKNNSETESRVFLLTPYYHDLTFTVVSGFVGLVFLLMALFVILNKQGDIAAAFLFWTLSLFGIATFSSPGNYSITGDIIAYVIRTFHAIGYSGGGLFFVLFILAFPVNKLRESRQAIIILSVITAAVLMLTVFALFRALFNANDISLFSASWIANEVLLVILLGYGTISFIKTKISLSSRADKRKTEWVIWGLVVGVLPYVIFWIIPNILSFPVLLREEFSLAFLIFVPVSLTAAVIKYHVLDIEVVVKRSFVYAILSVCIIGIYSALLYLISQLFSIVLGEEMSMLNLLAVLISALAFNPLRNRLNRIADRVFYREKYAFDTAISRITAEIGECISLSEVGKLLLNEINSLIPVDAIAIVAGNWNGERIRVLEQRNFDELAKRIPAFRFKNFKTDFHLPLAAKNKIEKGIRIDNSMENAFNKWNICIALPFMLESNAVIGAIILGSKQSGLKYSGRDMELLSTIASSASLALNRFQLREKIALEELEISKLEELNRLKSFYVASVSHDLKTPLTSIKMFAELLKDKGNLNKKQLNEYTDIIIGESDRLSRLIENVLDYAKIENKSKIYDLRPVLLNKLVCETLKLIKYDIDIKKFIVESSICEETLTIEADPEALRSAIMNLLSNSIKFSPEIKSVRVTLYRNDDSAVLEISDRGIGIPEEELKYIFDPFYRSQALKGGEIKGSGLGLNIVKNAVDAMNGRIEIDSKIRKGTTVRVIIKLIKND